MKIKYITSVSRGYYLSTGWASGHPEAKHRHSIELELLVLFVLFEESKARVCTPKLQPLFTNTHV